MHESRRFAKGEEFVREASLRNEFLAIPLFVLVRGSSN